VFTSTSPLRPAQRRDVPAPGAAGTVGPGAAAGILAVRPEADVPSPSPLPGHDGGEPQRLGEQMAYRGSLSSWRWSSDGFFFPHLLQAPLVRSSPFLTLQPALPGLWVPPVCGCGSRRHQTCLWHHRGEEKKCWYSRAVHGSVHAHPTTPASAVGMQSIPTALPVPCVSVSQRQEPCPACHPQNPDPPRRGAPGHERFPSRAGLART